MAPVVETADGPQGLATATYDEAGQYRFRLSRVWDLTLPRCLFVMLNPSTASAHVLDPTVTRCHRFARDWGHGSFEVVNIFAHRSTDPRALHIVTDPVGPGNDDAILAAAAADLVVAAWNVHGALHDRGPAVRALLTDTGHTLHHLRLTSRGHPGHPLYVARSARPRAWQAMNGRPYSSSATSRGRSMQVELMPKFRSYA